MTSKDLSLLNPAYWREQLAKLWEVDLQSLPKGKAFSITTLRIALRVIQDFMKGQLTLRAMSLVYTTLLSLVPLLALSFSMLKAFGIHNQLEPLLLKFLAPLGDKGSELALQIVQFVENIGVGVLGSLGLVLLVYTVVSLIQKIEAALNFIWHVESVRSLSQRLSGYLSVIMVGPLLVVTAVGITASTMNTGLVQEIVAIEPFGSLVIGLSKLVPYMLVIGAFSATYILIPHTNVKWRSALLGGFVAGILWETVGWGFASFIVGSAKYEAVYSGFAIVILFLFWLYLNWLVLLLGASIAFYHQNPAYQASGSIHKPLGNRSKELLALEILRLVGQAYHEGERKWTLENLLEKLSLPMESINDVLNKLIARKLIVIAGDDPGYFVPGRDLQTISINEVLDVVRDDYNDDSFNDSFADNRVIDILKNIETMSNINLENKTINDLISSDTYKNKN